ncbi:hypothetical protein TNCV_3843701 [Trichonephila clavipes]|nr:hypothetical protein TNCV_3843701 [Trichonephila clavipes]
MAAEWAGFVISQTSGGILSKSHVRYLGKRGQQPWLSPGASGLGPQWPEFSMAFQNSSFLGRGSIFVNVCGDGCLCSSEGQGNFRLSRLGSLLGRLFHCGGSQHDFGPTVPEKQLLSPGPKIDSRFHIPRANALFQELHSSETFAVTSGGEKKVPRRKVSNPYNKKCAAFPFETGIHFRRKTDFFPEEDTTKSYSGFEPESTRLQAGGHSHHTGGATTSTLI